MPDEDFLLERLQRRKDDDALRTLTLHPGSVDLCSNDYLGLARDPAFAKEVLHLVQSRQLAHGSGGSRLLAGNYSLIEEVEEQIARFHEAEAALVFNSGYDANTGFFSSVPQRGDTILYDRLIHASIHDGMRLSLARSFPFAHNDPADLEKRLRQAEGRVFVAVESVYSMDGHRAPLREITDLCERHGALLIVDEAHATGVIGERGEGLAQHLGLQGKCFARLYTFGKALGTHGAAVAGSRTLKEYLVNFARSLIYTTALPPAALAAVKAAYDRFPQMYPARQTLKTLVQAFRNAALPFEKPDSRTPIQGIIVPGNERARKTAALLQEGGLDVRPVLHPTVPPGQERLRIVLHAFNTEEEVDRLTGLLREQA